MRQNLRTGRAFPFLVALGCAGTSACDDEPADFAGTYQIAITNGRNGCRFPGWQEGESSQGISVQITQERESASVSVQGLAGAFLTLWLGSGTYDAAISGTSLRGEIEGMNPQSSGNCAYTINSRLEAGLAGDVLRGSIEYRGATNGNSDCASLQDCVSAQQFNGSRPPSAD
jgi:hypothetical protein